MGSRFWPWRKKSSQVTPPLPDTSASLAPYAPIQRAPSPRRDIHESSWSRPTATTSAHGIRPSPSVEPPRVDNFNFTASPSPPAPYGMPPSMQSAIKQAAIQLQSIPEATPGPSDPQHLDEATGASNGSASDRGPLFGRFQLVPKISVMNPEGFKMPLLANSGPKPTEENVFHAEVTRHGGVYVPMDGDPAAEASYQVGVTPPLKKGKLPVAAPIVIDPKLISEPAPSTSPVELEATEPIQASSSPRVDETGDDVMKPLDSGLAPPVTNLPMNSPLVNIEPPLGGSPIPFPPPQAEKSPATPAFYDTTRPTCSLNLVCYRSGGCDLQQIQCVLRDMFLTEHGFELTIHANPQLVYNDEQFFYEMKRLYRARMCGFFRRYFSLKTLRAFRVLCYTPTTRPTVVPFDDFVLQEMMYAYKNPQKILSTHDQDIWIRWVFRLRRKDRRHALEFVEGWNTTRIAIAGTLPWLSSCLVGVIWAAVGGDAQTAFTVASFILTSSSIILALLAIISSIESSGGVNR